jgi:hypothetical protein
MEENEMKAKPNAEVKSTRSSPSFAQATKPAAAVPAKRGNGAGAAKQRSLDPQSRQEQVRMAAYFRAQNRGFARDHELDDWLAAEAEVDARMH